MSKMMCLTCKHCIPDEDYNTNPEGKCVYNPPTMGEGSTWGEWPTIWLNNYCSKWGSNEDSTCK